MNIDRITKIYDEIDGYSIELAEDPTVLGPQYLGKVIAQCRNFLNRTTSILLEIRREKHMASNRLSAEKAAFKIESDGLLAEDERVRSRPNIRDREAIINVILKDRVARITELENDIRNLDAVEGAVKVRHTELVRTDGQIKTQRSLIRDELDTKSFYGDEENSKRGASDINEDELEALINGDSTPAVAKQSAEPSATIFTPPDSLPVPEEPVTKEPVVAEEPEPVMEAAPEPAAAVTEPEPNAPPPEPEAKKSELEDVLAAVDEAIADSTPPVVAKEPEPASEPVAAKEPEAASEPATVETSEAEDMERFLAATEAKPATKEKEPAAKGRKGSSKKAKDLEPEPTQAADDTDFADILASL